MPLLDRVNVTAALIRTFTNPFERPDRLPKALAVMAPWGTSIAGLAAGAAARYPTRTAIIDETGGLTFGELWRRSLGIAAALQDRGVGQGTRVGLLARNHAGFVECFLAVAASGADLVLLNTGFAGPQLADVVASEDISLVLHDDEFAPIVAGCGADTLGESEHQPLALTHRAVRPNRKAGAVVILTSGTTGRPKGASRSGTGTSIEGIASVLDAIPLRLGDVQVIPAPLFHAWGLSHLMLGIARCATTVLGRRFDPDATLRHMIDHRANVLVVVPVMLSRLLAVDDASPLPELRVIASSGSALGAVLATDTIARFGPVLYNLYGSTEVAVATVAGPDDLAVAPSTAGRAALGVRVEVLDSAGEPVSEGRRGRIFVGGAMRFDGYTDGGNKESQRGLVATGDLGYFDNGLLFVEGREDDMIVSGGENVFPIEIEDLLRRHPGVADVAVVGVPDDEFGQVLAAFVVLGPGAGVTADVLRTHVRDHLARHKVPRRVEFVDELPRNATGKLLRRELSASSATSKTATKTAKTKASTKRSD